MCRCEANYGTEEERLGETDGCLNRTNLWEGDGMSWKGRICKGREREREITYDENGLDL
jgi:hypothetical protein